MIEPRLLKGFRDSLPDTEVRRRDLVAVFQRVFAAFGYLPIDTPILEYRDVLLGKGGGETDKQVFGFTDDGGREVAMRFDLTVPLARFVAQHQAELSFPFRRYHIAKVFRGEKPQRGRYREFFQCDFDIVGTESRSADLEILLLAAASLESVTSRGFRLHISDRRILPALLPQGSNSVEVLRAIDRLPRAGAEASAARLAEALGTEDVERILGFVTRGTDNADTLSRMQQAAANTAAAPLVDDLAGFLEDCRTAGLGSRIVLDPAITRGLDYYTGLVFETFLDDLPDLGSVCSGGRYDDLTSLYTKQRFPGVGGAVGLDRLLAGLEELDALPPAEGPADLVVCCLADELGGHYHAVAARVRAAGLRVLVNTESRKLDKQLVAADRAGIRWALVIGPEEAAAGTMNLNRLDSRERFNGLVLEQALETIADA